MTARGLPRDAREDEREASAARRFYVDVDDPRARDLAKLQNRSLAFRMAALGFGFALG